MRPQRSKQVTKMTDIPEPETRDDLLEHEAEYQQLIAKYEDENDVFMGSVLFPREGATTFAVKAFHEAMTEHGDAGIEYAQEALHMNGDYFDDYFESIEEVREDIDRMVEMTE